VLIFSPVEAVSKTGALATKQAHFENRSAASIRVLSRAKRRNRRSQPASPEY
jgi:hypothetical protein